MTLGEKIRDFRKQRKLTQEDLAKLSNISRSYLADVERSRYNPSLETLIAIKNALRIELHELVGNSINVDLSERLRLLIMELSEGPLHLRFFKKEFESEILSEIHSLQTRYKLDFEITPSNLTDVVREKDDEEFAVDVLRSLETVKYQRSNLTLSVKEERDIATDLENMINELGSKEAMSFHGEPMDDETKELMKISLENSLRLAKQMAKQKFNPNKNK
ncbi:helix-turn-helix domain-containing protein [Paenibacillus sp. MCAF9]